MAYEPNQMNNEKLKGNVKRGGGCPLNVGVILMLGEFRPPPGGGEGIFAIPSSPGRRGEIVSSIEVGSEHHVGCLAL